MKHYTTKRTSAKVIPFRSTKRYAYPNQKDSRYYLDKLVDWMLAAITSAGALTALLFLMML